MAEPKQLAFDETRHVPLSVLVDGYAALAIAPADSGRLTAIVRRLASGTRELPETAELDTDGGLVGDAWGRGRSRNLGMQLTVMRQDVAELIANGQPLTLFGDNLFVDLDITTTNLPAGSRLSVGECLVEVTAEPHTGCAKFKARFGHDALKITALREFRDCNLRGIHWRVLEPGTIRLGDPIRVISRGAAPLPGAETPTQ
jgi:MOSC domain-containing protein YiiM